MRLRQHPSAMSLWMPTNDELSIGYCLRPWNFVKQDNGDWLVFNWVSQVYRFGENGKTEYLFSAYFNDYQSALDNVLERYRAETEGMK